MTQDEIVKLRMAAEALLKNIRTGDGAPVKDAQGVSTITEAGASFIDGGLAALYLVDDLRAAVGGEDTRRKLERDLEVAREHGRKREADLVELKAAMKHLSSFLDPEKLKAARAAWKAAQAPAEPELAPKKEVQGGPA